MKISYGITVHNEAEELIRLLDVLDGSVDKEDEVVVCVDGDNEKIIDTLENENINYFKRRLDGNFAAQKNSIIDNANGDYIFHLDADEYPSYGLLEYLKPVLEINKVDLIWVPRVNTVDGITQQHIEKWRWRVSEKGWINYPDYQARIFRRDKNIKWIKPVHEIISGAQSYAHLPPQEELSLYHPKTIQKQEQQNKLYESMI